MQRLFCFILFSMFGCASENEDTSKSGGTGGTLAQSSPRAEGGNPAQGSRSAQGGSTSAVVPATTLAPGASKYFGEVRSGNFWIGPVDYEETKFHNACGPSEGCYPAAIQALYGKYLMGIANEAQLQGLTASDGQLCDVCAELTANGQTLIARVITYGEETGSTDIDVSPEVDAVLKGSSNRTLSWRFTSCPTTAPIQYTFDGRQWSNTWFFRVWVRNARVPVSKVEYRLGTGAWSTADWQSDGAWQAASQDFGKGFSLRISSIDNQSIDDTLPGLNTFDPNVGIASHGNFQ